MGGSSVSFLPALGLLALLVGMAWAVQWLRRRVMPVAGAGGAELRILSQVAVGPQQRVVQLEVKGPGGLVHLTLGVTPQQVNTLHVAALPGGAGAASAGSATSPASVPAPSRGTQP